MNYKIYCTYHNKKLVDEYNLKETNNFKLFYTKDNLEGYSLNHLQLYLNEFVTQYYIWKNNIKSDYVGFCHYRRIININEHILEDLQKNNIYLAQYWSLSYTSIKEEWLLDGLNIHVDLVKEYLKTNEKYVKYLENFDYIMNNQNCINFGELYICKWEIFDKLMNFIEGYIQFLFYKLFNIEYKELYEYTLEEYQILIKYLNDTNLNLHKEEHIKRGDYSRNLTFFGGDRALGFAIEMTEALFWELDK